VDYDLTISEKGVLRCCVVHDPAHLTPKNYRSRLEALNVRRGALAMIELQIANPSCLSLFRGNEVGVLTANNRKYDG